MIVGLPESVVRVASHIVSKGKELGIASSFSPVTVPAAATYTASQASDQKWKKTQQEVAEVTFPEDFCFPTSPLP